MARKPRDQLFKKSDLFRLVESAKAKGLPIARIDVTREGLSLIVGEPAKAKENSNSETENWIAQHEHKT